MQLQGTEIMIGIITINASTTWEELADVVQNSLKVHFVTEIFFWKYWIIYIFFHQNHGSDSKNSTNE